jgi:uncharacterized membrane protein (Fun14 family)
MDEIKKEKLSWVAVGVGSFLGGVGIFFLSLLWLGEIGSVSCWWSLLSGICATGFGLFVHLMSAIVSGPYN